MFSLGECFCFVFGVLVIVLCISGCGHNLRCIRESPSELGAGSLVGKAVFGPAGHLSSSDRHGVHLSSRHPPMNYPGQGSRGKAAEMALGMDVGEGVSILCLSTPNQRSRRFQVAGVACN